MDKPISKIQLLEACIELQGIIERGELSDHDKGLGLCNILSGMLGSYMGPNPHVTIMLDEIISKWSLRSDSKTYPVPSGWFFISPKLMYQLTANKYSGRYGKKRIRLLSYIVHCLSIDVRLGRK